VGARKKLYTLTEVSQKTGISMPTLQKYKKQHADRIPSVGAGRKQRYPREAFPAFEALKEESMKGRGGARRSLASKRGGRRRAAGSGQSGGDLLSLQRIKDITGISYPTLLRYTRLHLGKIPHVGQGRSRRFPPEAVEVFKELRRHSPRGRRKGSGSAAVAPASGGGVGRDIDRRLDRLERAQGDLRKEIRDLVRLLQRPMTVTLKH
jgi:DNA-binding transcriptional MerR regulator